MNKNRMIDYGKKNIRQRPVLTLLGNEGSMRISIGCIDNYLPKKKSFAHLTDEKIDDIGEQMVGVHESLKDGNV